MAHDAGLLRLIAALAAAAISFCVVGAALFYKVAKIASRGWRFSGPTALTGEMAALFGGGLVALIVLIAMLRWGRGGRS